MNRILIVRQMIRYSFVVAVIAVCFASPSLYSQVDTFNFDTPEQQQRFRQLSDVLRCPQCQNASLTGSTGGVAEDLRREIHRMIMEGMSNSEIEQFMYERYGDFILYRPRLRLDTVLLWFGPLLFLVLGGFVAWTISRRASKNDTAQSALDAAQKSQLDALLNQTEGRP